MVTLPSTGMSYCATSCVFPPVMAAPWSVVTPPLKTTLSMLVRSKPEGTTSPSKVSNAVLVAPLADGFAMVTVYCLVFPADKLVVAPATDLSKVSTGSTTVIGPALSLTVVAPSVASV